MDIRLSINADFQSQQKQFTELQNSSAETQKKIEKFSSSFQDKNISNFINKQKLLEISLQGTRGETEAQKVQVKNYQSEIEKLVRSGLSPESSAIQRLATEQQNLKNKIEQQNDVTKQQADLQKKAEQAQIQCYQAIGAGIAQLQAQTQKTAELGDQAAKTARTIGMTAETWQELNYVAEMSGISNLDSHLQKLNKSMIDLGNGSGTLNKYLKDNDKQLLSQLQNVNSNEEQFMLLMDAINQAPNSFSKAEIQTQAFGKAGQDLLLIANEGTTGINALREEARQYGIVSNETQLQSEQFLDQQARLKSSLQGVGIELTSGLLPGLTNTIQKTAEFIAEFDDWENVIKTAGYVLAGLTGGVTQFLVVSKGQAQIQTMATAFKALNQAIAQNPIGQIAVVITAVLIPQLIALYKNWDTVSIFLSETIEKLKQNFQIFASKMKEGFLVAVNSVKIGFLSLAEVIVTKVLGAVGKLLEVMSNIPGEVGEAFGRQSESVAELSNSFTTATDEAKLQSQQAIDLQQTEQDAAEETLRRKLENISQESEARRQALEEQRTANEEEAIQQQEQAQAEIQLLADTEEQKKQTREIYDLDRVVQRQTAQANIQNTERQLREEEDRLTKEQRDQAIADLAEKQGHLNTFSSGFSQLFTELGKDNAGYARAGKQIAHAEQGINTALQFTKALASVPFPFNIQAQAGTMASGIQQQIAIANTAIPSQETGTGSKFIVPNTGSGVDKHLLRLNDNEEVMVRPRGMTGSNGESFNFSFVFDGREFATMTNKLQKRGELYTLQLQGNY